MGWVLWIWIYFIRILLDITNELQRLGKKIHIWSYSILYMPSNHDFKKPDIGLKMYQFWQLAHYLWPAAIAQWLNRLRRDRKVVSESTARTLAASNQGYENRYRILATVPSPDSRYLEAPSRRSFGRDLKNGGLVSQQTLTRKRISLLGHWTCMSRSQELDLLVISKYEKISRRDVKQRYKQAWRKDLILIPTWPAILGEGGT